MRRTTVPSGVLLSGVPAGNFGPATIGATWWSLPQPAIAREMAQANPAARMVRATMRVGGRSCGCTGLLLMGSGYEVRAEWSPRTLRRSARADKLGADPQRIGAAH